PPCVGVAFQPTTDITSDSATIHFSAAPGADNYTFNYSPGGTEQTLSDASPVMLTGLDPFTLYTVTVTSNCGEDTVAVTTTFRTAIGNDDCEGATVLVADAPGADCTPLTYSLSGATASGITSP